ncbi:MAG: hypothetical protein ABIJ18_01495 [archaeon]
MKSKINIDILLNRMKHLDKTNWYIDEAIEFSNWVYELGKSNERKRIEKIVDKLDELVIENVGHSAKTLDQIIKHLRFLI